jgi:hypothetical protein
MSSLRLLLSGAAVLALAAALLLDRQQRQCLGEGGHYELMRLQCLPARPILLERALKRSAIGDGGLAIN